MVEPRLKIVDVWKSYDDLEVIKGVSFELMEREVKVVFGPSGSGKSTLLRCINMLNPPDKGELRVFNQVTETFSVAQLAQMVSTVGSSLGYNVQIERVENPRVEKEEHYYNPTYTGLSELGLTPNLLTPEVLENMFSIVDGFKEKIE